MNTASELIDEIGRPRIMRAFGVGARALQIYAQKNSLPTSWFDGMEKMAKRDLPRHMFSFKDVVEQERAPGDQGRTAQETPHGER